MISSGFHDFILFQDEDDFYSHFHIMEDTRHFTYTDKMEFHVIELLKLLEQLKEDSSRIELWAKFIKAEKMEEFNMIAEKDPYIKSAYNQQQMISQDRQKRMEYEAREKAIRDHNQLIFEAEQRGERRGEQRSEQRGEQRGEQRINKLHALLIQNNRYDDLKRSVNDIQFQQQLMAEYGIS